MCAKLAFKLVILHWFPLLMRTVTPRIDLPASLSWLSFLILLGVSCGVQAGMPTSAGAPLGVMGHHVHKTGKWMLSYRYGRMEMDGNRDGSRGVSTAEVLGEFMVSPLDMYMEMHLLGLMYGAGDSWTLMLMLPYMRKSMELVNRGGVHFKTRSSGVGDIKLVGVYDLYDLATSGRKLLLNAGLSFPTGRVDARDDTPAGNIKLPYPMQPGSGTFDPILGVTYTNKSDTWSWGTQLKTMLRFGKNDEGYRLGHEYAASAWATKGFGNVDISFWLDGKSWGNVRGGDEELNPMVVPTARADLRGGRRLDALLELATRIYGHQLAAEFGRPIYQDLDGPQLETDYRLMFVWQKML